ncbi:MAG: TniQ family protein, partial [Chloroflexota bacterium]|nr:TniQ family protein [Chloroflexota bacterium]
MGFILRLTELNGYSTAVWILYLSRLWNPKVQGYSFFFSPPDNLEGLSRLSGVEVSELAKLCHPPAASPNFSNDNLFFGLPVSKFCIRADSPKICPLCLRESAYCRKVWDFAAVTVCPAHSVMLLDKCPRCNKRIRWTRKSVCACPCEFDFRLAEPTPVTGPELSLTEHIHHLCGLPTSDRKSEVGGNNPLLELTLKDCITALLFISGQYRNIRDASGRKIAPHKQNSEIHAMLSKAFLVFADWPRNYFRFLAWRRNHEAKVSPSDNLMTGLKKDFGIFYYGIFRLLTASQFDFLRDAFGEYLSRHWQG